MNDHSTLTSNDADHLRAVLAAGGIGLWELDLVTQEAWRNLGHDEIFGYSEMLPEWTYDAFMNHIVEEDRQKVDALYQDALKTQPEWSFECRINRADGELRWISATGKRLPKTATQNERLIGHVIDVTRIKRAEDRLRLMSSEQNHRVRNMLTVLQAMAKMTIRQSPDLDSFQRSFMGRIGALIRSHNVFTGEDTKVRVSLEQLIETELNVFVAPERVSIEGAGDLTVGGSTGEGMTLILHELLTNALKYGALSVDAGRVIIVVKPLSGNRHCLTWRETGGPTVTPPARIGFGTKLLRSSLKGSSSEPVIEYPPEGLVCHIEFVARPKVPN